MVGRALVEFRARRRIHVESKPPHERKDKKSPADANHPIEQQSPRGRGFRREIQATLRTVGLNVPTQVEATFWAFVRSLHLALIAAGTDSARK